MRDQAIVTPLNKDVSKISAKFIEQQLRDYKPYQNYNSVKNQPGGVAQFTQEFLNFADFSPHMSQKDSAVEQDCS